MFATFYPINYGARKLWERDCPTAPSKVYIQGGLVLLGLSGGCRGKLPSESTLLNPPTSAQIGTIQARKPLESIDGKPYPLMVESEQYLILCIAQPTPNNRRMHARTQQASKPVQETTEDQ